MSGPNFLFLIFSFGPYAHAKNEIVGSFTRFLILDMIARMIVDYICNHIQAGRFI